MNFIQSSRISAPLFGLALGALCSFAFQSNPGQAPKGVNCGSLDETTIVLGVTISGAAAELTELGAVRAALDDLAGKLFYCILPTPCDAGCNLGPLHLEDKDGNPIDLYDSSNSDFWEIEGPETDPGIFTATVSLVGNASTFPLSVSAACTQCRTNEE